MQNLFFPPRDQQTDGQVQRRPRGPNAPVAKTGSRRATWDKLTIPKVTVVIAAYNVARFVRQSVESALAQSLNNIEVIVIDDGSTDNTQSILRTFSDHRLILLRQENSGVSAARNVGLALARAPYVFFLDADDILTRDALAHMVATLDQRPDRIACFGHHIKIAEDGAELSTRSYLRWKMLPAGDTLRNLISKNFISGAICVRTEAARAVGGFNAALALGEDWEFWCRLATLGDFVAMPDEIILLYRQRFSSASYQLRESPVRPNCEGIDAIYANPTIRARFSPAELKRRRRLADIDSFWAGARNQYVQGQMLGFLAYLAIGTSRYPDSILRPRLVYLFFRGLEQHVNRAARSRGKSAFTGAIGPGTHNQGVEP
jgi:glycosyltransferase involved in cell wall biosynthesis